MSSNPPHLFSIIMANQNADLLLKRLLLLKESSPFYLVLDSLSQSGQPFIEELVHLNPKSHITYLSYETITRPKYASEFIQCLGESPQKIIQKLQRSDPTTTKLLIVVDSLNYVPNIDLTEFVKGLMSPSAVLVAVFHTDVPEAIDSKFKSYPSSHLLLHFMATSLFTLEAIIHDHQEETIANEISHMYISSSPALNSRKFTLNVANRRKSGRTVSYDFVMDTQLHTTELVKEAQAPVEEDESLLKDLTTFNLTTNSKQKLAREQVELPFMEAQESLGSMGGAIVYEFEKDDDYDEEDPYEDPF